MALGEEWLGPEREPNPHAGGNSAARVKTVLVEVDPA